MRHRVAGKHLSRTSAHRRALQRNLAASLFEHGTISTTREKARFVRPFAEKLITLAREGSLHARRRAAALLGDRDICDVQDGVPVKTTTVIHKLFSEIGPAFADRNGGYTRTIKLPLRRVGDNGQLVLLQLVTQQSATAPTKAPSSAVSASPQEAHELHTPTSETPEDQTDEDVEQK
ncbi:MAG: 50S ribosomal protein L17 [Sedimentisphaerales bacterium]|nr:50S ribosomal protein L17 [Sedimentisphaerales bacterium]